MNDVLPWVGAISGLSGAGIAIWTRYSLNKQWREGPILERQRDLRLLVIDDVRKTLDDVESSKKAAVKRKPLEKDPFSEKRVNRWWLKDAHRFTSQTVPKLLLTAAGSLIDWGGSVHEYSMAERSFKSAEERFDQFGSGQPQRRSDLDTARDERNATAIRLERDADVAISTLTLVAKKLETMDRDL